MSPAPPPAGAPTPPEPARFYSAQNLSADNSIGMLVKRLMQSLLLQVDRRLASQDLTHAQWLPLYRLSKGGCTTTAELARELTQDPGAMTRALDRLEAKGLVQRSRSQQDRRVVNLALTDAGRDAAAHVPGVMAEVLNAHLAGFEAAEWQQLMALLRRMLANGDALREGAAPPAATAPAAATPPAPEPRARG